MGCSMIVPLELRAISVDDRSALGEVYRVECAATAHARPGWVPLDKAARTAA